MKRISRKQINDWLLTFRENPNAAFNLGSCYVYGIGFRKNYKKALRFYKMAASGTDGDAEYKVAMFYKYGKGTKQSSKRYLQWLKRAADLRCPYALSDLGNSYKDGDAGIKKDERRAYLLYRDAARAGHYGGWHNLRICYEYGIGTRKNWALAKKCHANARRLEKKYNQKRNRDLNIIVTS